MRLARLAVAALGAGIAGAGSGISGPTALLWPLPASHQLTNQLQPGAGGAGGSGFVEMDPATFAFTSNLRGNDILAHNFDRYRRIVFAFNGSGSACADPAGSGPGSDSVSGPTTLGAPAPLIGGLAVTIAQLSDPAPPLDELTTLDESYALTVSEEGANLNCTTVWGALRGLETFAQMVAMSGPRYLVRTGAITDRPRFSYRGLMLDTARHWFPVAFLLKTLDAMAQNKLNVFHWHLSDAEAFSVFVPSAPNLAAYSNEARYTLDDVRAVVQHGRYRGIRVLPELDLPSHSWSWMKGYPEITSSCPKVAVKGGLPVDPTSEALYRLLENVVAELSVRMLAQSGSNV